MNTNWLLGGKVIDCSKPRVMAIVNATPDSFFAGSRLATTEAERNGALERLVAHHPDVIDVGGQSTRPGSERVGVDEEMSRVLPVIEAIRRIDAAVPITVDTYRSQVAQHALDAGADGVNDVSACRFDIDLMQVVTKSGCGYVLMHMLGTPKVMQLDPHYGDCLGEVSAFLLQRLDDLVHAGVKPQQIVVDPGIGFGKLLENNLALIKGASQLCGLGRPVLFGISRKRFIGELTGADDAAQRLAGTLGLTWELLNAGVMLHRVHDVVATQQLFRVWAGLNGDVG